MTSNQISDLQGKAKVVPVADAPGTQKEKLSRWAELVRAYPDRLTLFSNLEHWDQPMLEKPLDAYLSAFSLAAADVKFKAAGLLSCTAAAMMRFFNIRQDQLHEFSCDCGGAISNTDMARRIEGIAA